MFMSSFSFLLLVTRKLRSFMSLNSQYSMDSVLAFEGSDLPTQALSTTQSSTYKAPHIVLSLRAQCTLV
eukprot:COSAG05_NODE_982_length_6301_cov_14.971300_5_plen_69_part_00